MNYKEYQFSSGTRVEHGQEVLCRRARLQSGRKGERRGWALAPAVFFSATCALAAAKAEVRLGAAIGPTEVVPFYKARFTCCITAAIDPPEQN